MKSNPLALPFALVCMAFYPEFILYLGRIAKLIIFGYDETSCIVIIIKEFNRVKA